MSITPTFMPQELPPQVKAFQKNAPVVLEKFRAQSLHASGKYVDIYESQAPGQPQRADVPLVRVHADNSLGDFVMEVQKVRGSNKIDSSAPRKLDQPNPNLPETFLSFTANKEIKSDKETDEKPAGEAASLVYWFKTTKPVEGIAAGNEMAVRFSMLYSQEPGKKEVPVSKVFLNGKPILGKELTERILKRLETQGIPKELDILGVVDAYAAGGRTYEQILADPLYLQKAAVKSG